MNVNKSLAVRSRKQQGKKATAQANCLNVKNLPTKNKRNIYSMCDSETRTLSSSMVQWSLCTVLSFSLCDLWQDTDVFIWLSLCNKSQKRWELSNIHSSIKWSSEMYLLLWEFSNSHSSMKGSSQLYLLVLGEGLGTANEIQSTTDRLCTEANTP